MDKQPPFFVTGLPRSRTAWFANWLTTDRTICFHDPAGGVTPGKLVELWPEKRVGVSGPELLPQYKALRAEFPAAPWLLVSRPQAESLASFARICRQHVAVSDAQLEQLYDARMNLMTELMFLPGVRLVYFNELDQEDIARDVWQHLLPEVPFDGARWSLLNDLTVTSDIAKRKAREWR